MVTALLVLLILYNNPMSEFHDYILQLYYVLTLLVFLFNRKMLYPVIFALSIAHIITDHLMSDSSYLLSVLESLTLLFVFIIIKYLIEKNESAYTEKNVLIENLHIGYVVGTLVYDDEGKPINFKFEFSNQAFLDMMKITQDDIKGVHLKDFMVQDNRNLLDDFTCVMSHKTKIRFTYYSNSQNKWFDLISYPKNNEEFILLANDITEMQAKLNDIECISYLDSLTTLNNRRSFYQTLEELDKSKSQFHIVFFDMNGLKLINDSFGHNYGDEALIKIADILKQYSNIQTIPFRLGGDEFTIIYKGNIKDDVETLCANIKHTLSKQTVNGLPLSTSYGYAFHNSLKSINETIQLAEKHMYQYKITKGAYYKDLLIEKIMELLINRNPYELEHSKKTSCYATKIGKKMGLSPQEIDQLKLSAYYHDIGKITIDEKLLYNLENLSEIELKTVHGHTLKGYQLLRMSDKYSIFASDALNHHERYDGSGYPNGLKGEDIPLSSRIISVANAYSAMISNHSYKSALSKQEAIDIIRKNVLKKYDPRVVDALLDIFKVED